MDEVKKKANNFFKEEKYEEALYYLEPLKDAFENEKDRFQMLNFIGYAMVKLKLYHEGLALWEEALKIEPHNVLLQKNIKTVEKMIKKLS